ncbi:hypothetical protein MNAN1_002539 [Malassezia nana]|uniref:Uncharacterized protein n=1 Tax=Malassezia nana TaxID=180528 RepID=A0AAF0ERN8_9BASI|nr:hypothetical protein MNAN1_002539 [Malassezia nana]
MPLLVVPGATAARLERLCAREDVPDSVRQAVQAQLMRIPLSGGMPADPALAAVDARVPHTLLVQVAQWAYVRDEPVYMLASLLQGARVVYVDILTQPKELDESLEAIRRAQEESEYERMTAPCVPPRATTLRPARTEAAREEHAAWREARSQIGAMINVVLSMGAVATAVWWGAHGHNTLW